MWTLLAGKDVSWDVFNHHYYIPFAWMTGRIDADFFGAGPQSYQNPLGYVPFYFLVQAGLPAWAVGSALAALHATAIFFVWRISNQLWTGQTRGRTWAALGATLAAVCPSFLITVGTSSADPFSAALSLSALWSLLRASERGTAAPSFWAGALLGLALSLKLSNAIFVAAGGSVALWQLARKRLLPRQLAMSMAGGMGALVLGMGWHSWELWLRFGNPVFPFANNIFRSPYTSTEPLVAQRFMPDTAWQWVSRLWEMASMRRYVYQETFVPDLRPLVLVAVVAVGLMGIIMYGLRLKSRPRAPSLGRWTAADADVSVFAIVSYGCWLATSGNGRYAIALLMLMGVLTARACYLLLPDKPGRMVALVTIFLQMTHFLSAGDIRTKPEPWDSKPYLQVELPEELHRTPYLHVSVGGSQTNASLAALFHSGGALINPIGQMSIPYEGPLGDELKRRFSHWDGRIRLLLPAFPPNSDPSRLRLVVSTMIERLGLKADWNDCLDVQYRAAQAPPDSWYWLVHQRVEPGDFDRKLVSCGASRIPVPSRRDEPMAIKAEQVFSRLERECPLVYGPPPLVTERASSAWERLYANTDTAVVVSPTKGVMATRERSLGVRYLGSIEEIISGEGELHCKLWPISTPE